MKPTTLIAILVTANSTLLLSVPTPRSKTQEAAENFGRALSLNDVVGKPRFLIGSLDRVPRRFDNE
jgi:hypothetical protein